MKKGDAIRLHPTTFRRVPFDRLKPWCTLGTVRRVIGRENGRVLVEVEIEGYIGICWDFEVREVVSQGTQRELTGM